MFIKQMGDQSLSGTIGQSQAHQTNCDLFGQAALTNFAPFGMVNLEGHNLAVRTLTGNNALFFSLFYPFLNLMAVKLKCSQMQSRRLKATSIALKLKTECLFDDYRQVDVKDTLNIYAIICIIIFRFFTYLIRVGLWFFSKRCNNGGLAFRTSGN